LYLSSRVEKYTKIPSIREFSETNLTTVRNPAVAGIFYPEDASELHALVNAQLDSAEPSNRVPKAIIVPHAGYIYSGPVAASAYASLTKARDTIRRVVLLGPAHRVFLKGLALSSAKRFATPLGTVPIDEDAVKRALSFAQVRVWDEAHAREHSLEVQLPFLQVVLEIFTLVPLVVGDAGPSEIGEVLEVLWGGSETLIVVSSDLSHDHDYETARRLDRATSQAIERLGFEAIQPEQACGRNPIRGLLHVARKYGLRATTLDLRNSGDTAGMRDEVVGYGAYRLE
jgi:AmmeMemoRadiSam system protein B